MQIIQTLFKHRELLSSLTVRELKGRYKQSILGILWSLLNPLFMAIIYVFFLRLLARGISIEEIIIGVFAWQFTVQSLQSGLESITGNSNLVKKVFFPRVILPAATTMANLTNFLLTLVIQFTLLFFILLNKPSGFSTWIILLPIIIGYQTVLNLALSLITASSNVYFRDTQHLVGVFTTAWFFSKPSNVSY